MGKDNQADMDIDNSIKVVASEGGLLSNESSNGIMIKRESFPTHKIDLEISDESFNLFLTQLERSPEETQEFIDNYLALFPSLTANDLATLLLIKAIQARDDFLTKKIIVAFYEDGVADVECMVTQDKDYKTVVTHVLETRTCIPRIVGQIFGITNSNNFPTEKFSLDEDLLSNMVKAFTGDRFRLHPVVLIDDLIRPLYTEESVDNLINALGEDWFNCYYVKDI